MSVVARIEPRAIPTYPVGAPEKNPLFFEKRVYQGSSGKVYPVPFIDKVFDEPEPVVYQSALLENDYVRLVMLPEIGGRIFLGQDKTNNDYDFFYRQDVIKPALVGLAGPWISGGVEFNWPQHHRPGTFMPTDVFIEEEEDGARTVWMSEHDPINRMKGMHGIRLRPGSSLIELRGRLYNRSPLTQTFLWWANVAAMVHDQYQSFFPPDVRYVADHAVRAMSSFPQAMNPYYGVDYQNRPDANDLSWYQNIPVPTSYMVCQTQSNFFGGYDFAAGGGFVHVANRHLAPGKKQWTWGNHEFGWAWDRELTDVNGPYVELMAGVYTDNQPDFTYLTPFETKTFSQYWWPIQGIGPVQQANGQVALRMEIGGDRVIDLGICVSQSFQNARLLVMQDGKLLFDKTFSLMPGEHWKHAELVFTGENPAELNAIILDQTGKCLLEYRPVDESAIARNRELATEPPAPDELKSSDELYFTGEHLELYRHPTRSPELYWKEALRRDEGDARCNIGMGRRALRQGRLDDAEQYFRTAVDRLTGRHPNPETGEAHYFLGLSLVFNGSRADAYALLYKATWNQAWRAPAYYLIACLDCRNRDYQQARVHLKEALATSVDHTKAMVLQAVIARHQDEVETAMQCVREVLALDPLDHWARYEGTFFGLISKEDFLATCRNDAQTILDLAFEYSDAGFCEDAAVLLEWHLEHPVSPVAVPNPSSRTPMCRYVLAWLKNDINQLATARQQSADYFFPSRIHEQKVLEWAVGQGGGDPVAAFALGNYYYDLKRHEDAIHAWKRAADESSGIATVFRNLGIAVWNARRDGESARSYYLQALQLDAGDPRLVSEYNQLCSKLNDSVVDRLAFLESHLDLVLQRDDCTVALATLYNLAGNPTRALEILTSRRFHPWEGGEGTVLRQYTNGQLLLGRKALSVGDPGTALAHFSVAMKTPDSLGEAYHLLQAKADVNYWIGKATKALGRMDEAEQFFAACANEVGDFSNMAVVAHSPLSYYRGMALRELGQHEEAGKFFENLKTYAEQGIGDVAKIDYFATSLPNLLVFEEDLQAQRESEFNLLIALACHGLGDREGARGALSKMMAFTHTDQRAADLAFELVDQPAPEIPS
jgi:tetratricopeptide (TPR) repeat protein